MENGPHAQEVIDCIKRRFEAEGSAIFGEAMAGRPEHE
jgi:hypothetical protein